MMKQFKSPPDAGEMKDRVWTNVKPDGGGNAADACFVGEAIRRARLARNLTQEELGALVGVKRSQISKLEKGASVITLPTMSKVFKALGVSSATLDLGTDGKVALW